MSVYTRVYKSQLESFLDNYDIGELTDYHGIVAGITNTNYALHTSAGHYVLTLYENHSVETLDYILGLQHHLASNGIACAAPVLDINNRLYATLNRRPAAIIHRLPGQVSSFPTLRQAVLIGTELARFHLAGRSFGLERPNPCGLSWCQAMSEKLGRHLSGPDRQLLQEELESYQQYPVTGLPRGTLHADLFLDNVLFDGDSLSGIIDFDFACNDVFIYDLCVTINEWCSETDGNINPNRMDALIRAYQQLRPLQEQEHRALPMMFRATTLRFWLSRLNDKTFPVAGELTFIKNPDEYRHMLLMYRNSTFLPA